jgi:hypothetical protein
VDQVAAAYRKVFENLDQLERTVADRADGTRSRE